ncbi:MAG: uroporphyrinogen-III synthase [Pseudomonadota bacterium]
MALLPEVTLRHGPYNAVPVLMYVLLTRPEVQARDFAGTLPSRFEVVISPVLEIKFLPVATDVTSFNAVVFTSQNGVLAFENAGLEAGMPAFCVGDKTAALATRIGLKAVSAGGNIDDLNALLEASSPNGRFLHVKGVHTAGEVKGNVTRVTAYDQVALPLNTRVRDILAKPCEVLVPLFSPRSAQLFQQQIDATVRSSLHAVCLSKSVASVLDPAIFASVHVSEKQTAQSIRDKLSDLFPAASA